MARIYIGRTTGIGSFERHVVLKLITPERANDHTAVQMFLDEARLAASLNHQNVAQVFEVGEDSGIHYLAMEYVHGQDLRALLAKAGSQGTRVPLELAMTVVAGAAAGLNHAHERRGADGVPLGIVHRDVSPSNIMIGYDGSVKLLDFGIAKATARSIETQSGIIKGKFAYMAPEQCRGRDVDRRSDVFSLGIILYEISTQHRCFRADSDFDTMHRIVTGDVVRPTRLIQGYPPALEAIVMKALAVDPQQRYQSAGALLEALEAFAVSSRMSLSTMSLGRFMRDMFGDQPEPWLSPALRQSQPVMPRESTISNTNGTGEPARPAGMVAQPAPQADSGGANARTILDLPRGEGQHEPESQGAEWNAKSYPTMQPPYASPHTPPEGIGRSSQPHLAHPGHAPPGPSSHLQLPLPPPDRQSSPAMTPSAPYAAHPGHAVGSQPMPVTPAQPMPRPPAGQWPQTPGSGSHSGPAHGGPPVVSTRTGYANAPGNTRGDVSYPRYAPPVGLDDGADLQLTPNRRPLYIGLGIAAVGIIILLAMTLGNKDEPKDEPTVNMNARPPEGSAGAEPKNGTAPETTSPDKTPPDKTGSASETRTPEKATPSGAASGSEGKPSSPTTATSDPPPETRTPEKTAPVVTETSIAVQITSEPEGAEVLLGEKLIGTTPLVTKLTRAAGTKTLTIRKSRYVAVTRDIDLSKDFTTEVALKKEPGAEVKKPPEGKKPPEVKRPPANTTRGNTTTTTSTPKNPTNTTPPPPPKPACQQPAQYDPTDPRPPCKG